MSEMFGCKAFRQFLFAEGILLRASTQRKVGLSQRNSCFYQVVIKSPKLLSY